MRVVQKALIALFAVMFAFAVVTQPVSPASASHCKCCVTDPTSAALCPTFSCESRVREEAPAAPVPAASYRGIDWQTLAAPMLQPITLAESPAYILPTSSVSSLPLRAVPIFQRD